MRIRVLTYNMRKGKGVYRSRPRLDEIARSLGELQPDLLLCQEVAHRHGPEVLAQSDDMARALDLLHRYEPNAEYAKGHHGNATFSRFHIGRHVNRDISTNTIECRGILYARIEPLGHRTLHVFNTHFGLNQGQRLQQALWLAEFIDEMTSPSDPVIVAGDFNDWNGRVNPVLEDKGRLTNAMRALDASARRTWSSHRPRFALDRVYVRNLAVAGIQVLKGAPWHRLSDHLPVRAELVLDGGPGPPAPGGAGIVTPGR